MPPVTDSNSCNKCVMRMLVSVVGTICHTRPRPHPKPPETNASRKPNNLYPFLRFWCAARPDWTRLGCSLVSVRRYATLESNMAKHKPELSDEENLKAFNSFTPGYPYRPDVDMEKHIPDACPNKAKVGKNPALGTSAAIPPWSNVFITAVPAGDALEPVVWWRQVLLCMSQDCCLSSPQRTFFLRSMI